MMTGRSPSPQPHRTTALPCPVANQKGAMGGGSLPHQGDDGPSGGGPARLPVDAAVGGVERVPGGLGRDERAALEPGLDLQRAERVPRR